MNESLSGLTITSERTIKEAISLINQNGRQFLFVVSVEGKLVGLITDGDIRRAILETVGLDQQVSLAMNKSPITATPESSKSEIRKQMLGAGIRQMPILDAGGFLIDCVYFENTRENSFSDTPIVLMAGGKGQRLYPLTKDVPKPMLQVGNVPIIGLILMEIARQGFKKVFISVNYLGDQIVEYVGDGSRFGLVIDFFWEEKPLGTAGSLAKMERRLESPFIVMNADLLTDISLQALVQFHKLHKCSATVAVREHLVQIPFGVVGVSQNQISEITEKPINKYLVSAGIYLLNPETITGLPQDEYLDMPQLLNSLLETGKTISAFPIHEQWIDIGRPDDLAQARHIANEKLQNE